MPCQHTPPPLPHPMKHTNTNTDTDTDTDTHLHSFLSGGKQGVVGSPAPAHAGQQLVIDGMAQA
jgi:hypothetical protein